jgi:hypothetical protein
LTTRVVEARVADAGCGRAQSTAEHSVESQDCIPRHQPGGSWCRKPVQQRVPEFLTDRRRYVVSIKEVRDAIGLDIAESREVVEVIQAGVTVAIRPEDLPPMPPAPSGVDRVVWAYATAARPAAK